MISGIPFYWALEPEFEILMFMCLFGSLFVATVGEMPKASSSGLAACQKMCWSAVPCYLREFLWSLSMGPLSSLRALSYGPLLCRWSSMMAQWVSKDSEFGAHAKGP